MGSFTRHYESDAPFDETVEAVTDALGDAGFGILCDIDVQATLREKLGEDFRRYRILGACNPPLAHEALSEELDIGALLPCNVVIYEDDDGSVGVSAVDPGELLSLVGNPELEPIGEEVGERFDAALSGLSSSAGAQAAD